MTLKGIQNIALFERGKKEVKAFVLRFSKQRNSAKCINYAEVLS